MDDDSGYDGGSELSLPSSDLSRSNYKRKKPCEICGSDANENQLMTCFLCRDTREHIYCMRALIKRVPTMWVCEECCASERTNQVVDNKASIDQTVSRSTNQVVDKEVNMTSGDSGDQISATHQPSQAHSSPLVEEASSLVPMDTSPVRIQKLPDSNLPSDSESAI